MKKILFLLLFTPLFLIAEVHYAKVEPYNSVVLKSSVRGLVRNVILEEEGHLVRNKQIISLDDTLDKINLNSSKQSLILVKEMLSINKQVAKNLHNSFKRKESYYHRINRLSTASKTQKDNAYSGFVSTKTQYLGTKEKIVNLNKQILDMKYKISQLKDTISKKSIILDNKYLYKLMVKEGDYVAQGSALAEIMDISRAKLVIFLEPSEVKNLKNKIIYIDNKKTDYIINKIWKVADKRFISSYRAEIYINAPKDIFSKLLKFEIK